MKRLLVGFLFIFCIATVGISPAHAYTDPRCMNLCATMGKSSAVCLPACTLRQSLPIPPSVSNSDQGQRHNMFHAPAPMGDNVLLTPTGVKTVTPTKDYQCLSQCVRQEIQYDLCGQLCTKPVCLPNVVLCRDSVTAPGMLDPIQK